jgi:electron transfer flavoprotein beta subunit
MSVRQSATPGEKSTLPSPMKAAWNAEVAGLSVRKARFTGCIREEDSASVINMVEGGEMEIIVCVKKVLDPDLPPAKFTVDAKRNQVIPPEGIPLVINPYDAIAVEAALRIKEAKGGRITVITLGEKSTDDIVRKAIAMGADEGLILSDTSFDECDGFGTAHILSQAIKKIGTYDLILCGRQAVDWDRGMVGPAIAEYLEIPVVTLAKGIQANDGKVKVERVAMDGYETFEVKLPALVTVSNELGQARIPSGWGIIKAAKKEIPIWTAKEIEIDPSRIGKDAARNQLLKLYIPSYERKCEFVTGNDIDEVAVKLASKLAEKKQN